MNIVKINVEVHCLKPGWVSFENNRYRLYINNDLLTERNWIWDLNTKIDENIFVDLPKNSDNIIKLEPIVEHNSVAKFALYNLRIDDEIVINTDSETTEIPFKTYKYKTPRKKEYETLRIHQRRT
jgi:hypothetical protein